MSEKSAEDKGQQPENVEAATKTMEDADDAKPSDDAVTPALPSKESEAKKPIAKIKPPEKEKSGDEERKVMADEDRKVEEKEEKDDKDKTMAELIDEAATYQALTAGQKKVVLNLQDLSDEHNRIETEYENELLILQAKYIKKYKPLYEKRTAILSMHPVAEEEAEATTASGTPCLPSFWLNALKNSRHLNKMIRERDEPVLEYVKDVRMEWLNIEEQLGFKIIFEFQENSYFSNRELIKTFHLQKNASCRALGDKILTSTEGTEINWFPGKDITVEEIQKTQRHKRTNQKRVITTTVPAETFFSFFKERKIPKESQIPEMDRREFDKLEEEVENDVEAGCDIRDEIIPRAVTYFLGLAEPEWSESDSGSEASDMGDSDRDSDEDDSDNSADGDDDKKKSKDKEKSAAAAAGKPKEECKAQ